jgi:isoquinoline 1-oxidoreductase beta subunit
MANQKKKNSRRQFLIKFTVGTGVMVGMTMVGCNPLRRTLYNNFEAMISDYDIKTPPTTWFEITAENQIIFHCPKVEMGQGAFTGLAQIAAEELEVEIEKIEMVHATTADRPIDPRSTGGSDSISALYTPLRELAAKLREMLRRNAAEIMGVSIASISIENGVLKSGGKSMTYGEVVQQATKWKEPKEVKLKDRKDFKVIGKALPRVDLMPKILGDPIFGMDVTLPGMLYGVVLRPPKIDTVYVGADDTKAKSMPGVVQIVKEKDFVAVVAKSRPEAEMAARAMKVDWKTNKKWEHSEIVALTKVGSGKDYLVQKEGSSVKGEDLLEAEYSTPAGAHAQMEPNGSVAHVEADKAIVYISTQVPNATRIEVAETLGFKEEQVEIQPTYLGGGFGRRLHTPNAMQAALISRAVGKPVHVFYSRQDEFQSAEFRPPTHHVLKGRVNNGKVEAIEHNTSSGNHVFGSPIVPSMMENLLGADIGTWAGGRINYSKIPNVRVYAWKTELPFSTTMWRAPGLMANTFAVESFMDELAHKAEKDPVDFRIAHLPNDEKGERQKRVIKAAAEKAGWGKPLPKGHALGIATCGELGAIVAEVVEVSIEDDEIKVHKVTCAIDPGFAVNPDGVRAQVEGAIIMGLSASLYEKMEIVDSKITPTIFGPYRMAMMKDAPKEIDVIILESSDKPSGVGEPPIGPIGAAVGNAVFALTGKRLRDMPLNDAWKNTNS